MLDEKLEGVPLARLPPDPVRLNSRILDSPFGRQDPVLGTFVPNVFYETKKREPFGEFAFRYGLRWSASAMRGLQRLVEIGHDVVHVLDPDRDPDHFGLDPCLQLFRRAQLRVGGGRRMDHQRAGVEDVRQV